jgi:hypothetical protein
MLGELLGVGKRQRHPETARGRLSRILRVVQMAVISKPGSACEAGVWAKEANPRLGFAPTIPTRILLLVAMGALSEPRG